MAAVLAQPVSLSPAAINAAKPGETLKDTVVRGLQLRAFASRKAFYLYYRSKSGRQRRPKIGEWPGLTLPKARRIARDMLDQVAAGRDPSTERTRDREAPTVADLCDRFMIEHGQAKKSADADRRLIRMHIIPRIGRERVAELTYDRIYSMHRVIGSKRGQVVANRVLALMSTALNMAERWSWRPTGSNPCRHVRRFPERPRRRYMTAAEATEVWKAIERERSRRPRAAAFILLLIYTGARKGEIAAARWADLDGDVIRLPDSKSGHPRTIHLPPQAMAAIDALPRTSGTIVGIVNPYKAWHSIRTAAGCPDLRIHDLRHSFASHALAAGFDLAQIGELLGHKSMQTTMRYAHLMEEIGRATSADTADLIESRMKSVKIEHT